jgi:hypothetical protein
MKPDWENSAEYHLLCEKIEADEDPEHLLECLSLEVKSKMSVETKKQRALATEVLKSAGDLCHGFVRRQFEWEKTHYTILVLLEKLSGIQVEGKEWLRDSNLVESARKDANEFLATALKYMDSVFEDDAKTTVDEAIERHRNGRTSHAA